MVLALEHVERFRTIVMHVDRRSEPWWLLGFEDGHRAARSSLVRQHPHLESVSQVDRASFARADGVRLRVRHSDEPDTPVILSQRADARYDRERGRKGLSAPDFSLISDTGEEVAMSEYRGKPVVLYFYPRDDMRTRY